MMNIRPELAAAVYIFLKELGCDKTAKRFKKERGLSKSLISGCSLDLSRLFTVLDDAQGSTLSTAEEPAAPSFAALDASQRVSAAPLCRIGSAYAAAAPERSVLKNCKKCVGAQSRAPAELLGKRGREFTKAKNKKKKGMLNLNQVSSRSHQVFFSDADSS